MPTLHMLSTLMVARMNISRRKTEKLRECIRICLKSTCPQALHPHLVIIVAGRSHGTARMPRQLSVFSVRGSVLGPHLEIHVTDCNTEMCKVGSVAGHSLW